MRYYVTLFDSNYLTRGLVLYRSLLRHAGDFHLWIICFDDRAYQLLSQLNLEKVTLVSLSQFEDEELLRIKSQRSQAEYYWTCTPSTGLYVLKTEPQVDAITYLDADLMFFSSPEPIFAEAGNASIIITEHRYLPELSHYSAVFGTYNVQFMTFRRDAEGLRALNWWRDRCIEWCFDRVEDDKFGDQKYLDGWPERFKGVHIVQHLGAGLAPWNAVPGSLRKIEGKIFVENAPLIFYHFHSFKIYHFNIVFLHKYPTLNLEVRDLIYPIYFQEMISSCKFVQTIDPTFNRGIDGFPTIPKRPDRFYSFLKQKIEEIRKGRYLRYA
jgi:hypothetical protein